MKPGSAFVLSIVFYNNNFTKIVIGTFKFHVFLSSRTNLSMLRKCPILFKYKLQQNLSAEKGSDSVFCFKYRGLNIT